MASAGESAPTPSARSSGLTPGRRPGAHRDQPPHRPTVHSTGGVSLNPRAHGPGLTATSPPGTGRLRTTLARVRVRRPRGTAPGLTHPGPACAGNPCDGEEAVHAGRRDATTRTVYSAAAHSTPFFPSGWVNPGPTARGSPRPTSTPADRAQHRRSVPKPPGPRPRAHRNQPPGTGRLRTNTGARPCP